MNIFVWSLADAVICAPIASLFLAIHGIGIGPCFITIYILSNLSPFFMHASFFCMHVLLFFFLYIRE